MFPTSLEWEQRRCFPSEAKFHKWRCKGTDYRQICLLSIHHRRIVFCLIDCKPAGVRPARASPGARSYRWVGEGGAGGSGDELANSHAHQGTAFGVTVGWWTADKVQESKQPSAVSRSRRRHSSWGGCLFPISLCAAPRRHVKMCSFILPHFKLCSCTGWGVVTL